MAQLLPPWPLFTAFLLASLVLAITPGPGVFYIVTRSLLQGRRCGLASVAGVALGNLGNAMGASLGLAALFAVSSAAFVVVKYAGAAYLVWLGLQALRAPRAVAQPAPAQAAVAAEAASVSLQRVVREGFVVALLNPKTALFFAAFLPQFLNLGTLQLTQTALLGSIFVLIAAVTDSLYALTAGALAPLMSRSQQAQHASRYVTAASFIGLGLFTALSSTKAK